MILADTNRNSRVLSILATDTGMNPYQLLYNMVGVNYTRPFSLKTLDAKTIGKFWKFAEKHLSSNHDNYIIVKSKIYHEISYSVIYVDVANKIFDISKSFQIDQDGIRLALKAEDKYILSLPKKSRVSNRIQEFTIKRTSPNKVRAISKFSSSVYLNEFVRVSNVDEVLQYFKETNQEREREDYEYVLPHMLFKGYKKVQHKSNLANSDIFNPNIINLTDSLPLDKSGYNRYLYRRELFRRLNEFKSDKVFAEYDTYTEVKLLKETEMKAKELFLDIVRKRSVSKLSHERRRIKSINLLANITRDYASICEMLQQHFKAVRQYRIDNITTTYDSLESVMQGVVNMTETIDKFIQTYKKFSASYRNTL